jgi:hypothetical protein
MGTGAHGSEGQLGGRSLFSDFSFSGLSSFGFFSFSFLFGRSIWHFPLLSRMLN